MAIKHPDIEIERCRIMRAAGQSVRAIALATGIPASTVYQIVTFQTRVGDERPKPSRTGWRPWYSPDVDYVRKNAGWVSVEEMARHLDRSEDAIRALARKEHISLALRDVVDPHDEYLCCELYKEGLTTTLIAKKMELKRKTVNQIIKTWGLR
ncbi:sigma-70 family RNA polymerase sigma factor [Klebsiella pneumoniae]|nr:sigma-70 family RNA polymerase sigma factor [Klebsiella pneumoniae]